MEALVRNFVGLDCAIEAELAADSKGGASALGMSAACGSATPVVAKSSAVASPVVAEKVVQTAEAASAGQYSALARTEASRPRRVKALAHEKGLPAAIQAGPFDQADRRPRCRSLPEARAV